MKRRVMLGIVAQIGVATLFTGCGLIASQKMSENTDNLKPWEIKSSKETHYSMDPLFAITEVNSKEEAEVIANKLIEKASTDFMIGTILQQEKKDSSGSRYKMIGTFTHVPGVQRRFTLRETDMKFYQTIVQYVEFKIAKVGTEYYLVIANTNAKNVSVFSTVADVFIAKSRADQAAGGGGANGSIREMEAQFNWEILSYLLPSMINKKPSNVIDIHTDSKDSRADEYRNIFTKYFRG